ncbi:hypothetical protein NM208_g148 [Fusarium decemcellulare]|uniref:Uncharacterized protein n=1 Tax=Fusarium decemcellulare TaxID=57161 RepID=A0ACC1T0B0_9HYPO|nr:hypothetical protein NM208_g148 [Fusarium decemcellulare]
MDSVVMMRTTRAETHTMADDSRKPMIIAVLTVVLTVAFIALCMRIFTRAIILKNFGSDDWCSVCAFITTLVCGIFIGIGTEFGLGKHESSLSDKQIEVYKKTLYTSIVVYNVALAAIKITFLLQYHRVIITHKLTRVYIAAFLVVNAWSISQILVQAFVCIPVAKFWKPALNGRCIPNNPQWYINAAGNITTDIMILIMPIPIIRGLSLGRRQKYILLSIFCLGFFTCTISLVRIRFLNITDDVTWVNVDTASWSIIELCSGIVCACLPTLRPLASRYFPGVFSRSRSFARGYQSRGAYNIDHGYRWEGAELGSLSNHAVHPSESRDALHFPSRETVTRVNPNHYIEDLTKKDGQTRPMRGRTTLTPGKANDQGSQTRPSTEPGHENAMTTERLDIREFT